MQKSITTTTTTTLYQILNSGGGSKSGGSGSSSSSSGSLLSLLVNHTTYTSTSTAAIDLVEDGPNWNHPLLGLLLITMTIITIFGNTLVICAVIRERCLKSVTYYFIVSLAVADLIVGLFVMPFNSLNKMTNNFWFFGDVWCDIWHSMDVFASTASINSLLIIALDRHSAISDPINYHTTWLTRYWVVFVALIWIGSACISFPAIAYWRAVTKEYLLNTCVFPDDIYYLVFSSLVSFYIPLVIMVVVYVRIYRAATRQMYALKTGQKVNVKAADGTQLTLRIHRGGYHAVDNANTNTNAAPTSNAALADNNAHNHNESAAAAKRKSLVHTDSYHAHVPISDRYKKRNSEEKENNQVQNTTAILSAVKDHRKTSTGSAAVAQLLNLTKQPSLTSLLDLGIICGPLGSDTNGLDNNNHLSSPTSRGVRPRLKAAATSEEKSSSLDKKEDDEDADRNNRGEIILEPLSSSSPSDSLAPSSPPPTSPPPPPLTITATSNECQHGVVTTTNETESSTTTTSMLKAPKLARNEASISSLSSFFMNNQLKTLNFLYYPSLITKSKWSSKSSHCEAKSDVNSVDNRVSKDEISSGSKKSSPTSSSSEPQSMRMRRQPPQHQATITSAPLSETHEARQRGAGGKIMEKSNSEERENTGKLGGGRAGALDLLSEYSQVKSSESIDEAVMQEKLAAYLAHNKMKRGADAADETCDGASPNIGRSIRTKIIDSIKRRLSLPNENGPLYNVGIGDKNTTNGEERNAALTQEKSPSNKNQVGKLVLTPMEKEKLRRQLEYYHKHYMEHTMQLRRQQQQQQQDSAGSPTPNTPDWSTTNIEHKRRLFRFGQASKAKLRSLIMKRDGTMSINNNAPVSRNSSAYSSAYSFNSASFKQRGNGSVHHEHRSPHYASGAANAAAAASVRRKCSGATTMSAAAAIAIAKAKNTTCHSASKKTNSIASKVKGLTLAKKLSKFSREQKAAKTLGIVMGVFILCWLPFFIYNVITGIFKANLSKSHEFIYSIFTWFGYMNSGCNPIIYAFSSRDFRRAFTKILCPARFWRKKTKLIGSSTGFHRLNHSYTEASTLSRQQTKLRHQAAATTCPTCQTYENLILAKMNAKQQDGSKKTTTTTTTTTTAVSKFDSEPIEKKSPPPQNKILPQLPPPPPQPQSPTPSVKASPLTPTIDLALPEATKTSPASLEYTFIKCKISNQPQEFVTRENEIKNQQQQQHEFELLKFRLIRLDNNNNVINNDNNNNMSCSTTDQVNNTTTRVRTPPPALQSPSQPNLTIIRDLTTSKQQQAFIMSKAATANATSGSPTDVSPTIPGVGLKLPILKLAENQQPSGSFSSSILVTGGLHRRHNNSSLYTLARNLRRRIHSMFLVKRSSK